MIDLYTWKTPNGLKVAIMLEELGEDFKVNLIDIRQGEQFSEDFLRISPNNKIPAIVDHDNYGSCIAIFESGAILQYLADKYKSFLPAMGTERYEVLQWLFWQVGGLGPMAGQTQHFVEHAPQKITYAIHRYASETTRLYSVLDRQLVGRNYICGAYSIADIACYPWIAAHELQCQDLTAFPNITRWFSLMQRRPAVVRAHAMSTQISNIPTKNPLTIERADWNQRYATNDFLWTLEANQFLVEEVMHLPPGKALDLACGEGRNAVWLAAQGWQVRAVDFSDVAINKGMLLAVARNVADNVDFEVADLNTYTPTVQKFDLVTLVYLQLPWAELKTILMQAINALSPGGTFLFIGHDLENLERGYGGPQHAEVLNTVMQLVSELEGMLEIEKAARVERKVKTESGVKVALDCVVRGRRI